MRYLERSQTFHVREVVACRPGNLRASPCTLMQYCYESQQPSGSVIGHPSLLYVQAMCIQAMQAFTVSETQEKIRTMEGLP